MDFFLTILVAGGGALVLLYQAATDMFDFYLWASAILAIVLLVGESTYWRLNARLLSYMEYSRAMNAAKMYFASLDTKIGKHLYFLMHDGIYRSSSLLDRMSKKFPHWFVPLGGLHTLVTILNSILSFSLTLTFMSLLALTGIRLPIAIVFVAAGAIAIGNYIRQVTWAKRWIGRTLEEGQKTVVERKLL